MLKTLIVAAVLFFALNASAQIGLWGGKWDDQWTVFVKVEAGTNSGQYKVTYRWTEHIGSPMESMMLKGTNAANHIHAKFLLMRFEKDKGMLYGDFENPRMANLVKIPNDVVNLEKVNLRDHGWKTGAIPAAEAKKLITKGSDAKKD